MLKTDKNDFKIDNTFYDPYRRCLNFVEMIIHDYIDDNKDHDVVSYIKKRIKSEDSIKDKLDRSGISYNYDNIRSRFHDIAGIRIVCPFLRDVNEVIDFIRTNPYFDVVKEKDYINNPKASGYRSYHMIVNVKDSVLDGDKIRILPVEIQIRTLAMDCSADLEHETRYKKEHSNRDANWVLSDVMNRKIASASLKMMEIDEKLNLILEKKEVNNDKIVSNNDYNLYKYEYAEAKLKTIVKRIEKELNSDSYKPVEAVRVRLKSNRSIDKKLRSRGKSSVTEIHDVVAARFICPFLSDLDKVIDKIIFNSEFEIIGFKDYVNNPKDNGYSSFHILVNIPVYIDGVSDYVKVEIQVRTIVMNMWASLHHKLCYEQNDTSSEVAEMLKLWAIDLRKIDEDYDNIYKAYNESKNNVKRLIKK